eukprot:c2914_g1_i2.p3 GENE.c2914_g1_i2~~c2914_g1_i2.p3  ORF type:complete len:145 (-),score=46.14 c2914_g1_i2:600-1034(-)
MGKTASGRIFAFDIDHERLETLKRLTAKANAKNIVATQMSFLDVNPRDRLYKNVRAILLDPTCSGSGMVNQLDHLSDESRMWKLPESWTAPEKKSTKAVVNNRSAENKLKAQLLAEFATSTSMTAPDTTTTVTPEAQVGDPHDS